MRVIIAAFAIATVFASPASAQQSAREQCCKHMGGTWRTGSGFGYSAQYYCYGVNGDAFYKCVASGGTGGSKNSKKK